MWILSAYLKWQLHEISIPKRRARSPSFHHNIFNSILFKFSFDSTKVLLSATLLTCLLVTDKPPYYFFMFSLLFSIISQCNIKLSYLLKTKKLHKKAKLLLFQTTSSISCLPKLKYCIYLKYNTQSLWSVWIPRTIPDYSVPLWLHKEKAGYILHKYILSSLKFSFHHPFISCL